MTFWTPEMDEVLVANWQEGLSCSQCADVINRAFATGFTRNSVIGRVHRLGIQQQHGGRKTRKKFKEEKQAALPAPPAPEPVKVEWSTTPRAPTLTDISIAAPESTRVTLMELAPNHCRWPMGDPMSDAFHFCGGPRMTQQMGSVRQPYCAFHAGIGYQNNAFSDRVKKSLLKLAGKVS